MAFQAIHIVSDKRSEHELAVNKALAKLGINDEIFDFQHAMTVDNTYLYYSTMILYKSYSYGE